MTDFVATPNRNRTLQQQAALKSILFLVFAVETSTVYMQLTVIIGLETYVWLQNVEIVNKEFCRSTYFP
jgi:hypothetical protein